MSKPKRTPDPKWQQAKRKLHESTRPLRRNKGIAPGFAMYLRLWLFADLRCPRCGKRGHWIDLPGVPRHFLRPKGEEEARMSDYNGRPIRHGETGEVWRCDGCEAMTYSPEARAWTQGGGPYNVRPHETRVFTGNVSDGFAWEHDEDDEPPTGIDAVENPWTDVDSALDGDSASRRALELIRCGTAGEDTAKALVAEFDGSVADDDRIRKVVAAVKGILP